MSPEPKSCAEGKFSQAPPAITREEALSYLTGKEPLHDLFARAAALRERYFGRYVRVHILDNIRNGNCAEDCTYCAQRRSAGALIEEYPLKSDDEILAAARAAKAGGAYRFCMVTSGTGPSAHTTARLAALVAQITSELKLRVCLSAGLLDEKKAAQLAAAGLDRYNHNLNTSENHYSKICTSHTYAERIETLRALAAHGVGTCSGVIVGLGETAQDLVDAAFALKKLRVISIPVNFFIPVPGHAIAAPQRLTPEFCLRVLVVFRLVNPDSEIRLAAGREGHLRSLQAMALMVANSLFAEGYLNVKGANLSETLALISDAGLVAETSGKTEASPNTAGYSPETLPGLLKYPKKA